MFNFSGAEIIILLFVALIFIGPKDLPVVIRNIRKFIHTLKGYANEFYYHIDDMIEHADLSETKKNLKDISHFNPIKTLSDSIDPDGQLQEKLSLDWDARQKEKTQAIASSKDIQPVVTRNLDQPPADTQHVVLSESDDNHQIIVNQEDAQVSSELSAQEKEILNQAPIILPPSVALRLIKESPYWEKPDILPPEIALHDKQRVRILSDDIKQG